MSKYNVMVNDRPYLTIDTESVSMWLDDNQWNLPEFVNEDEWTAPIVDSFDINFPDDDDDDDNHMIVEVVRVSTTFIDVKFIPV